MRATTNRASRSAGGLEPVAATVIEDLSRVVPQGAIISGVLETAINSDLPGFARAVVSDDIEVGYQDAEGLLPWGGTWTGFDGFRAFLATVAEHLVIEAIEVLETHVDGETAITVLNGVWTVKRTTARVEARVVNVFTMRGGRVARYQVFPDTAAFARGLKNSVTD